MICDELGISLPTLRARFDGLDFSFVPNPAPPHPISVVIDATFFGRAYGYLCFHDGKRVIYAQEIKTESVAALEACLTALEAAGYRFSGFTLDGKRGFMQCLARRFPGIPVQMCHFHQQAIIRRYITQKPKSDCGLALKELMKTLGQIEPQIWIDRLFELEKQSYTFLSEKNEKGQFTHRRLRSAFRSLKTNLPHLFVYHEIPSAIIPNTTNALEGCFSHLKEKINIHRGLKSHRKKKAIQFLLYHA